jgi:hypothetical protein
MSWSRKKIETLSENVRVATGNIFRFPEIKNRLLRFGFDDDRLNEGLAKADNVESLYIGRKTIFGLQMVATKRLIDMIDAAYIYYMDYASVVKKHLKRNIQVLEVLGLRGNRRKTLSGTLTQAKQFFTGLKNNQEILDMVACLGITQQVIDDGIAKLDELQNENELQEAVKGDVQTTTQRRNRAIEDLNDYWQVLKTSVNREFKDEPQLKEKLEIKEYTPGYVKKKKTEEPTDPTQTDPTQPVEQTTDTTQEQQGETTNQ